MEEAKGVSERLDMAFSSASELNSKLERVDQEQRETRSFLWDVQQGQKVLEVEIGRLREAIPEEAGQAFG